MRGEAVETTLEEAEEFLFKEEDDSSDTDWDLASIDVCLLSEFALACVDVGFFSLLLTLFVRDEPNAFMKAFDSFNSSLNKKLKVKKSSKFRFMIS